MKKYISIIALSLLLVACQNQSNKEIKQEVDTPVINNENCNDLITYNDNIYGNVLGYKNEYNAEVSLLEDNMKMLDHIQSCGEDLNKKLKNDTYYLIEAIQRYNENPELIHKLLSYNVSVDIKDKNGNDMYTIALAMGINDESLLEKLSSKLTEEEINKDKDIIKLTLFGSQLSIKDIEDMKNRGISLNQSLADYSYIYMEEGKKYEGGTILASALINQDIEKVKWLLENGADPSLNFGTAEFEISPLKYTLSTNLELAEMLLQYDLNLNEIYPALDAPISYTLLAEYSCNKEAVELLKKYGAVNWHYEEEGKTFTQNEIEQTCRT